MQASALRRRSAVKNVGPATAFQGGGRLRGGIYHRVPQPVECAHPTAKTGAPLPLHPPLPTAAPHSVALN